jgi:dipeptidyl aminopeptidase/acylaminoacyl peptidase
MQRRIEFYVGTEKLVGDLHLPQPPSNTGGSFPKAHDKSFPCVINSHGFGSNRKKGKGPQIAQKFPSEGIAFFNIDHRGALGGESDGKFEETTLTKRINDLMAAVDSLSGFEEIDSNRVGLIGSSLGGRTVLAMPKDEGIKAIATLAAPIYFAFFPIWIIKSLEENGYYVTPDGIRVNKEFYIDFDNHDFEEEARNVICPMLIIHGQLDEQIPCEQAEVLYEAVASPIKELKIIRRANHGFTDADKSNEVLDLSLNWFKKYL